MLFLSRCRRNNSRVFRKRSTLENVKMYLCLRPSTSCPKQRHALLGKYRYGYRHLKAVSDRISFEICVFNSCTMHSWTLAMAIILTTWPPPQEHSTWTSKPKVSKTTRYNTENKLTSHRFAAGVSAPFDTRCQVHQSNLSMNHRRFPGKSLKLRHQRSWKTFDKRVSGHTEKGLRQYRQRRSRSPRSMLAKAHLLILNLMSPQNIPLMISMLSTIKTWQRRLYRPPQTGGPSVSLAYASMMPDQMETQLASRYCTGRANSSKRSRS